MAENTVLTTESNVFVSMRSSLGDDKFIITKMEGYEGISEPFEFFLEMYAHDSNIDLSKLIGTSVTITLKVQKKERYFNGIIGKISQGDSYIFLQQKSSEKSKTPTVYTAKIYPDFWKLKFNRGFQVYQEKTVNEIVSQVLEDNSMKLENKSNECGKTSLSYCVQYDESAFNFVSRLLENAGIYYFFDFSKTNHEMIAGDDKSSYMACQNIQKVPLSPTKSATPLYNVIYACSFSQDFTSKAAELNDYAFEEPRTVLKMQKTEETGNDGTVSSYPGGYKKYAQGEKIVKIRAQELEQSKELMKGNSTVSDFSAGHKFKLEGHPNASFNKEYVLKKVYHHVTLNPENEEYNYSNSFEAFSSNIAYRPPQKTRKPRIFGSQTAIVTGKKDEEIWVDKYGRVKVSFHWEPKKNHENDKSSCWIRVAQGWAGKNWGMLFTPRCNQEVVVSFLNGDPDHPLITGSVYNGDNMPPYLPETPTMSTIKSSTSKGGKGFNELRFNDKKDSEEVFIHAQKDMNVEVINAFSQIVQEGDEIYTIKAGNRTVLVQGDPSKKKDSSQNSGDEDHPGNSVNSDSQNEVKKEQSLEKTQKDNAKTALDEEKEQNKQDDSAGKSGSQQSSGNDILIIKRGSRFIYLKAAGEDTGNHSLEIERGNNAVHIKEGDDLLEIKSGDHKIKIDKGNIDIKLEDGNEQKEIKGKLTHNISKDYSLTVGGNLTINVDGQISMKAGKGIDMTADKSIVMKADEDINATAEGACKIDVDKECNVQVGRELSLNTNSSASISASSSITMRADQSFSLTAGSSMTMRATDSLSMNADMDLSAKAGTGMSLEATTSLTAKGGASVSIDAGGSCDMSATGTVSLDGALISIG